MSEPLREALAAALCDELDAAFGRIRHCVGQLTDELVWARPRADMNAVGNLLLHLTGNVRQLILSVVGGEPDDRDRPAEFAARGPIPATEMVHRLADAVGRAKAVIESASTEELCRSRSFRDSEWTGVLALVRSVSHFRGHTQEVIHMTRMILGERYKFAGMR
jgi:hypothetical protein